MAGERKLRKNILKESQDCSLKQECGDNQGAEQNNDGKLLRIAGIMKESIVDGPGIRFAIFCQGCPHDCKGCHNPSTHNFQDGEIIKISNILKYIDENPLIQGVVLLKKLKREIYIF